MRGNDRQTGVVRNCLTYCRLHTVTTGLGLTAGEVNPLSETAARMRWAVSADTYSLSSRHIKGVRGFSDCQAKSLA